MRIYSRSAQEISWATSTYEGQEVPLCYHESRVHLLPMKKSAYKRGILA